MMLIIFLIWFVFAIACGILDKKSDNSIYLVLFLLSIPLIFYIPLFLK